MILAGLGLLALGAAVAATLGPRLGAPALRRLSAVAGGAAGAVGAVALALAYAPLPVGAWYALLLGALALVAFVVGTVPFVAVQWWRHLRPPAE